MLAATDEYRRPIKSVSRSALCLEIRHACDLQPRTSACQPAALGRGAAAVGGGAGLSAFLWAGFPAAQRASQMRARQFQRRWLSVGQSGLVATTGGGDD